MKRRFRQYWLLLHLYCGITLGGMFTLLGITGSVLVFYLGIDETLNPKIQSQQLVETPPSVETVLDKLRQQYPERDGPWRIEMPLDFDAPITARYYKPQERVNHFFAPLMVTLDPATLAVTSHRFWGDYAMTWIYDLHFTLLLDEDGRTAVGIIGLLMLVSLVTGLYLWWPSRKRMFSALRLQIRKGSVRCTYDLHVLSGAYFWLVLVLVALTGGALALPDTTRSLLDNFSLERAQLDVPSPKLTDKPFIDLDSAVRTAQTHFPMAEVRWIESSSIRGNPINIRLYQTGEPSRRFPRTKIWLHPQTGEILALQDPKQNMAGDSILAWLHPLHNGEAFGLAGRIIILSSGLILPLLFITGVIRWRHKKRARAAKKRVTT